MTDAELDVMLLRPCVSDIRHLVAEVRRLREALRSLTEALGWWVGKGYSGSAECERRIAAAKALIGE